MLRLFEIKHTHVNVKAELSVRGECDVNVNLFLGG